MVNVAIAHSLLQSGSDFSMLSLKHSSQRFKWQFGKINGSHYCKIANPVNNGFLFPTSFYENIT